MAAMITRTVGTFTIHSKGFSKDGTEVSVPDLIVEDTTCTFQRAVKLLTKRNKDLMYVVTSIDSNSKTYAMTTDDFMAHAKIIREDVKNG